MHTPSIQSDPIRSNIKSATLRYDTMRYDTIHYNTMHYTILQFTTIHYNTLQYITIHYITLQHNTIQYTATPSATPMCQDLARLEISPASISHTSDWFPEIIGVATKMLEDGLAFIDPSPQEEQQVHLQRRTTNYQTHTQN